MSIPYDPSTDVLFRVSGRTPAEALAGAQHLVTLLEAVPPRLRNRRDLLPTILEMSRLLEPGSATWDLLEQEDREEPEPDRTEAADRLAREHYPKGRVFHPDRWPSGGLLDRAFRARRGEASFAKAWAELAQGAIAVALGDLPDDTPAAQVYQRVRSAIRTAMQRDLLGRTLDAGDPTEKLRREELPTSGEILALAELRADLLALPADDRQLLLDYYEPGADHEALARRHDLSYPALRQRVHRLVKKLT